MASFTPLNGLRDRIELVSPRAMESFRKSKAHSQTGRTCYPHHTQYPLILSSYSIKHKFRLAIDYVPGKHVRLGIKSIQVDDEDVYSCEITYLEPLETCDASSGEQQTNVKVIVPPSAIVMTHKDESLIRNGSTIGPLKEGHRLELSCEVRGARPQPILGWYRGGKKLTAHETVEADDNRGLFNVNSKLILNLSRQELGNIIECRVKTTDDDPIISNQLFIDLEVRPTRIHLSGVKSHVVEGSKVLLQCHVYGARPAANISWYNSTKLIDDSSELTTISTKAVRR